ncbi:TIGR04076 family protein [Candidatus Lokiarchaeum ossiferum]|uniref:TIGR04076 family protein n=1 Tax=Candidatus Lokiarchaeum ossiferum TaxID=2951803 RepID=UPI00352C1DB8
MLKKVKITVIQRSVNKELAEQHHRETPPICSVFEEGQEFIVNSFEKPANFCDWAWMDIQRVIISFLFDGNLSHFSSNPNEFVMCCTDAYRPVSFKIEKIDD